MTTHDTIKAPAPPNLSGLCWKEQDDPTKPHMFARCEYRKGHLGKHQWEDDREQG